MPTIKPIINMLEMAGSFHRYHYGTYRKIITCNMADSLGYDEACMKVINNLNVSITMMAITTDCYKCDMADWVIIDAFDNYNLEVYIYSPVEFGFKSVQGSSCNMTYSFNQHGVYEWIADFNCNDVVQLSEGGNPYTAFFVIFGIILVLVFLCAVWKVPGVRKYVGGILRRFQRKRKKEDITESEVSVAATTATTVSTRVSTESDTFPVPQVVAIQVFRGISIMLMVLCNSNLSKYWFFQPSIWNGLALADLSFPWFIWSMGAALYFKYRAMFMLDSSRLYLVGLVGWHSVRYIILGFFSNTVEKNDLKTVRIPGHLQRYGILNLFMFILEVLLMKANVKVDDLRSHHPCYVFDSWIQSLTTVICMAVNILITYLVPFPDCPTGYTGPGGHHLYSGYFNCTGGIAGYLDEAIFGHDHISENLYTKETYLNWRRVDADGALQTLNCFWTIFCGIQAARIFVYFSTAKWRVILLLVWGFTQIVLALCLCGFMKDEGPMPLNRTLWSASFALLTSGLAFITFTLLYVVVDVYHFWSGSPMFEAGLNIMLIYVGHIVLQYSFPFSWQPIRKTSYTEYTLMGTITVMFWIIIAKIAYIYRRIILI